jgi:folate-binding Fe-S cluster repair protein YgfZ
MCRSNYLIFSGADQKKFIQGQCTNDINKLTVEKRCIPATFLSTKGRIMLNCFVYLNSSDQGEELLIEGHEKLLTEIKSYLTMFKLRSKVTIEMTDYKVYLNTDILSSEKCNHFLQQNPKNNLIAASIDPRGISSYGMRMIGASASGEFPFPFHALPIN